jgi:hypothetical protein
MSLEKLREEGLRWVEANRSKRFSGVTKLLTDLYPDNAHFIYELLQNAEDARDKSVPNNSGASLVRFTLSNDALKFEHNGEGLFTLEDVGRITGIGDSTKRDDPTSIGKFGLGFKAVFAYTNTPEIHSGEFHFCIHDLVVPETNGIKKPCMGELETRFIFPFDHPKKPSKQAVAEIEQSLRALGDNTLLFLNHIRTIEYQLPESSLGSLKRIDHEDGHIEIRASHPGSNDTVSHWLRFYKDVDVIDEDGTPKTCPIAIAFSMEKVQERDTEKAGKQDKQHQVAQWRIRPLERGQVSIYFPADKETSNLRFHLHAPFASTVARDSVRDCSANNELRDYLANLIAESMTIIRDQGLLTVGFLATLPNDKDNLPPFYKPIQNSLIKAFQNEDLTPMKQGGHAAANRIFRGLVQLSNLISDDDLATILGEDYSPPMWLANPPQRNQREDNFLSMLNISEWTTESLMIALSAQSEQIMRWLAEKTDEWQQQLYVLLGDFLSSAPSSPYYEAQNRKEKLAGLRIVRMSDGTYSIGRKCYFPSDGVEHDDLMPRVAKGVYTSGKSEEQQKKAKDFLEKIGVREAGEAEQVETILKGRYSQEAVDRKAFNPRMEDIKRFISLVEKDPSHASLFKDYFIFKLTDGKWGKPSQVYLDSPFYDTGLTAYYATLGDRSQCWGLSQDYEKSGISHERIGEFAKKVGSKTILDIKKNEGNCNIDYTIDHLDKILQSKSLSISKLIWNAIVSKESPYGEPDFLRKQSRPDGRYRFCYDGDSSIITNLKQYEWVPQKNQKSDQFTFVKPADADSRLLPDGFPFDNGWKWVDAVAFGSCIRQREESERLAAQRKTAEYQHAEEAAKSLGFGSSEEAKEMAELKRKDPEGYKKWQESNKEKPSFPNRTVANQVRRQERLAEQLADAPEKEFEIRERSVRITMGLVDPALWLRNQYTNDAGQMVCQICKKEMPFKKRNGEYYFEKKEALSREHFTKEHEAQYLALCPLCAAMFEEFVKRDESAMQDLNHALKHSAKPEVPLKLGELETSIRFVESHWQDLRMILQEKG